MEVQEDDTEVQEEAVPNQRLTWHGLLARLLSAIKFYLHKCFHYCLWCNILKMIKSSKERTCLFYFIIL